MNIVKAASLTSITLSGEQVVDGVSCVANDLVFVVDTIYTVSTLAWQVETENVEYFVVKEGDTMGRSSYVLVDTTYTLIEGPYA